MSARKPESLEVQLHQELHCGSAVTTTTGLTTAAELKDIGIVSYQLWENVKVIQSGERRRNVKEGR